MRLNRLFLLLILAIPLLILAKGPRYPYFYMYADSTFNYKFYNLLRDNSDLSDNFHMNNYVHDFESLKEEIANKFNSKFVFTSGGTSYTSETCSFNGKEFVLDSTTLNINSVNDLFLYRKGRSDLKGELLVFLYSFLITTAFGYIYETVEYSIDKDFNPWLAPSIGGAVGLTVFTVSFFTTDKKEYIHHRVRIKLTGSLAQE